MSPATMNMLFSAGISLMQAIRAAKSDNPNTTVDIDLREQFVSNINAVSGQLQHDIAAELERRSKRDA